MTLTDLADTQWTDATFLGGSLAGLQAFSSRLDRVVFAGCKLDSVNFRDAELTGVTCCATWTSPVPRCAGRPSPAAG